MLNLARTNSDNKDFQSLMRELDEYLRVIDGSENSFYAQHNKADRIKHAIVAYKDGVAAGIGALRQYSADRVEVKRMYVSPAFRRQGVAQELLAGLEGWAMELGFKTCILETGKRTPDAVALYLKAGYGIVANYEPYIGMENSVCMAKTL